MSKLHSVLELAVHCLDKFYIGKIVYNVEDYCMLPYLEYAESSTSCTRIRGCFEIGFSRPNMGLSVLVLLYYIIVFA